MRAWSCFVVWLILAIVPAGRPAEEDSSLAGSYRDEEVTVEINAPTRSGDHLACTGTVRLGADKFPLRAEVEEGRLKGTFQSQGQDFEFTGSIVGRILVFTTGGTTYRLTRQTANPLARPSKPNPLAQPHREPVAPASASSNTNFGTAKGPAPAVATTTTPGTVRFVHRSVLDDANMIGGEAFGLLAPADWQLEGGVGWRLYPSAPAFVAIRVSDPTHTEAWEIFPTLPFVWSEEENPSYPPGSHYLGNEVARPLDDPSDYVKRILLPRFRRNVPQPRIISTEEMPKVAEVILESSQEAAIRKTCRAARTRVEYEEGGKTMQEDIYCVLVSAYAPNIKTTLWGPERNYSFKAEKGKLDGHMQVFQTMVSSFRPNLRWFNRYFQLVQILLHEQPDASRPASELGLYLMRTNDEITEPRRQVFERQQIAQDRVNASFLTYVQGLELFRDPFNGRAAELPAGYRYVWANSLGEVLLTADASINPNLNSANHWLPVEKLR
jgi:hypothetical protein